MELKGLQPILLVLLVSNINALYMPAPYHRYPREACDSSGGCNKKDSNIHDSNFHSSHGLKVVPGHHKGEKVAEPPEGQRKSNPRPVPSPWWVAGERCDNLYCMGLMCKGKIGEHKCKSYIRNEQDDMRELMKLYEEKEKKASGLNQGIGHDQKQHESHNSHGKREKDDNVDYDNNCLKIKQSIESAQKLLQDYGSPGIVFIKTDGNKGIIHIHVHKFDTDKNMKEQTNNKQEEKQIKNQSVEKYVKVQEQSTANKNEKVDIEKDNKEKLHGKEEKHVNTQYEEKSVKVQEHAKGYKKVDVDKEDNKGKAHDKQEKHVNKQPEEKSVKVQEHAKVEKKVDIHIEKDNKEKAHDKPEKHVNKQPEEKSVKVQEHAKVEKKVDIHTENDNKEKAHDKPEKHVHKQPEEKSVKVQEHSQGDKKEKYELSKTKVKNEENHIQTSVEKTEEEDLEPSVETIRSESSESKHVQNNKVVAEKSKTSSSDSG